jgi:hypothetical protein
MHEVSSLWIGKKLSLINIISINSFLHNSYKYNLYITRFSYMALW